MYLFLPTTQVFINASVTATVMLYRNNNVIDLYDGPALHSIHAKHPRLNLFQL